MFGPRVTFVEARPETSLVPDATTRRLDATTRRVDAKTGRVGAKTGRVGEIWGKVQLPVKVGRRFWAKARIPSRASAVWNSAA